MLINSNQPPLHPTSPLLLEIAPPSSWPQDLTCPSPHQLMPLVPSTQIVVPLPVTMNPPLLDDKDHPSTPVDAEVPLATEIPPTFVVSHYPSNFGHPPRGHSIDGPSSVALPAPSTTLNPPHMSTLDNIHSTNEQAHKLAPPQSPENINLPARSRPIKEFEEIGAAPFLRTLRKTFCPPTSTLQPIISSPAAEPSTSAPPLSPAPQLPIPRESSQLTAAPKRHRGRPRKTTQSTKPSCQNSFATLATQEDPPP